jgi:hypothetical protein
VSANKLKEIALAMHNYAENNGGHFPPSAITDNLGKPLLSWRVVLLPYLEEEGLFEQFHLDEPWDSAHNLALLEKMPKIYRAPRNPAVDDPVDPGKTFYQVFVGEGTAFDRNLGLKANDLQAGTSNTILVIEAGEPVPWTKPVDLNYSCKLPIPPLGGVFPEKSRFSLFGSNREKGITVAMADGSVHFIKKELSETTWRAAIAPWDRDCEEW